MLYREAELGYEAAAYCHVYAFFGVETRHAGRPAGPAQALTARRLDKRNKDIMVYSNAFAPARPANRTLATILAAVLAAGFATPALAQATPPAGAAKPAAKPATPAKPQAAQPAAPAAGQPQAAAPQQPNLIYSPWTKFCLKGQEANAKQVCFTGKDGRLETGVPVVAAVVIEPEGEQKKLLRVTLPLGMQVQPGTRVIIDNGQPATGPYVICFTNGCMADYEVNADVIGRLKKGQQLAVQAINGNGQPVSLTLPLNDFAKAYDGPPTDPKVFEAQQKKLQEELQKKAEEARQKLQQGKTQ